MLCMNIRNSRGFVAWATPNKEFKEPRAVGSALGRVGSWSKRKRSDSARRERTSAGRWFSVNMANM
jgi:hypothetical protein